MNLSELSLSRDSWLVAPLQMRIVAPVKIFTARLWGHILRARAQRSGHK